MSKSRSSQRWCSVRKGVLRNFAKFTGKHLCQSLFFSKVAGQPATLLKKRLWHMCFFLWILRNFYDHLFYRSPLGDCFCQNHQTFSTSWMGFFWKRKRIELSNDSHLNLCWENKSNRTPWEKHYCSKSLIVSCNTAL